jgi:hypothetical protein
MKMKTLIALLAFALALPYGAQSEQGKWEVLAKSDSFWLETETFNAGNPDYHQRAWVVSLKDRSKRELLPRFDHYDSGYIYGARFSPDERWLFFTYRQGSHATPSHLYRREIGLKFVPQSNYSFDDRAWEFFCQNEDVPLEQIDIANSVTFIEWRDASRFLFKLTGRLGLTQANFETRNDSDKPGVSGWAAYYNCDTGKFELTDELRAENKDAARRWGEGKREVSLD